MPKSVLKRSWRPRPPGLHGHCWHVKFPSHKLTLNGYTCGFQQYMYGGPLSLGKAKSGSSGRPVLGVLFAGDHCPLAHNNMYPKYRN